MKKMTDIIKKKTVRALYVGKYNRYRGESALVKVPAVNGKVMVQFDDSRVFYDLAHHWHEFDESDWAEIEMTEED